MIILLCIALLAAAIIAITWPVPNAVATARVLAFVALAFAIGVALGLVR